MKKTIVVVDAHPVVREGIIRIVGAEKDLVVSGQAGDAGEGINQVKALKPDLVVTELTLEGTSGIELVKCFWSPELLVADWPADAASGFPNSHLAGSSGKSHGTSSL